ncbi:MAG TPA: sulfotransferase [Tetrasphaera sp.]|uniref:sulfotransferase n=1 Tax=Nostocoides sp. TaxID=1917966 RepID=UPI002BDFBB6D|nr:sulfotransferase [Tetrasphaera sp.]HNQ06142.1 sulfotransferase [Tetrasphaera sp.]
MPSDSQVRVLYVGGTGRSGSTVVANALGALDDAVSVGEVRYLWERGITENRLCGCGQRFANCPFWQQVLDTAYGTDVPNAHEVHRRLTEVTQLRTLPGFLRSPAEASQAPADLADVLRPLYAAIATVSGASLVVDSSKLPTYAGVLAGVDGLTLDVVHLVRDPRAAAFSWKRTKEQPDRGRPGLMEQRGVVKSSVLWTAWNAGLERAWRRSQNYTRVRYETFAAHPAETIALLADFVGHTGADRVVDDEGRLHLPPNHTVAGNPARMSAGPTPVRLDNEWATAMNRREVRVVSGLTAPLLGRYGYPRAVGAPDQED